MDSLNFKALCFIAWVVLMLLAMAVLLPMFFFIRWMVLRR